MTREKWYAVAWSARDRATALKRQMRRLAGKLSGRTAADLQARYDRLHGIGNYCLGRAHRAVY